MFWGAQLLILAEILEYFEDASIKKDDTEKNKNKK